MKVTTGIRQIIEDWHTKGVSPEETAQSLRIPIDEVKAIILQADSRTTTAQTPRIPRTTVRAGKTRRHRRQ